MDLKELSNVDPNYHWYYLTKLEAFQASLSKNAHGFRLLDIGSGSGYFALQIAKKSAIPYSSVVCYDPNYKNHQVGKNSEAIFTNKLNSDQIRDADVILLIDVLEHVSDDKVMLEGIFNQSKNGALFLISVPAFMSLWSHHDVFLEHHRRYRLEEVILMLKALNAEILESRYLFGSIFPIVWLLRKLRLTKNTNSDLRKTNSLLNKLLTFFLTLEHKYFFKNKLFGVSAFVVARKRSDA